MESKEWSKRLGKFAKYCLIGFFVLLLVILLFPIMINPLLSDMVQKDTLGFRNVFGCDPNSDPCCAQGFNSTILLPQQNCKPGQNCGYMMESLKSLCASNRWVLSVLAMCLFIIGIVAWILSWILKPKKGKPGILKSVISWLTEPK